MDGDSPTTSTNNPLLTRLQSPPTQFPSFSSADLNDWILKQSHEGVNKDFSPLLQEKLLQQEVKDVASKLEKSEKALESSSGLDVYGIVHRIINTHPHIQHLTFPLPKFILDLKKNIIDAELQPHHNRIKALDKSILERRQLLDLVRRKQDALNDLSDEDYSLLEQQHENDNVCTDIFATCRAILESNEPRSVVFITPKGPHTVPLEIHTAQSILDQGLYVTAKNSVNPVSREDFDEEFNINSAHILALEEEKKQIQLSIATVNKGDYSILSPGFNPYANVDRKMVSQALSGITGGAECFQNNVKYYPLPLVDIEGNSIPSDPTPINLIVRSGALNRGYGYFFQLGPGSDPSINQPNSPKQLSLERVYFEPVFDGARSQSTPLNIQPASAEMSEFRQSTLHTLQPKDNYDLAQVYYTQQSATPGAQPDTKDWFQCPLDYPFNRATQKRQLSPLEQYKANMGQAPTSDHKDDYCFADHTFKCDPGSKFNIAADSGGIATSADQSHVNFILQIINTLSATSTHYTIRLYFNGIRRSIEELVGGYNQIKREQPNRANAGGDTTTTAAIIKPVVYDRSVPLAGLYNQGVTCYLNTYLQALYGLPYMRKALFYLPITHPTTQNYANVSSKTWVPLCTQVDQAPAPGSEHQLPELVYIDPNKLRGTLSNDASWIENTTVDQRYTTSLREHFARHGKFGKHVAIPELHTPSADNTRPVKHFVYQKLIEHVTTQNTLALQRLFFSMQQSAFRVYRDIYAQLYNRAMGHYPNSLLKSVDKSYNIDPNTYGICAEHTKQVTQSFLSKEFGWRQAQLHEQQDLQELARKVVDNLEKSTFNTIVEGLSQRLFKGTYENVIEAIDVDFAKVTEEAYEDLILPVKDCNTIADSFRAYQAKDEIQGYRTDHPQFGVQTVHRSQRLTDRLPPVLTLMLKRMDFDYTTFEQTKINSRLDFPAVLNMSDYVHHTGKVKSDPLPIEDQVDEYGVDLDAYSGALDSYPTQTEAAAAKCSLHGDQSLIYDLYSVLVHAGNIHAGHYINFIRPLRSTDHLTRIAKPNNEYLVPDNEYQVCDEMDGLVTGMANTNLDGAVPTPPPQGSCSCNFNHYKAEFYRAGDWFCFDDQQVSLATAEQAINDNYGNQTNNRFNAGKSAYLLMYIQRKYTYSDATNSGDDLVFHPAVNSALGKQLLPASALPSSDIPLQHISSLIAASKSNDHDLDEFTDNDSGKMTNTASSSSSQSFEQSAAAPSGPITNPHQVFERFNNEFERVSQLLHNIEAKTHLTKLAALQTIHVEKSGFLNIYAPLNLQRVYAQEKAALQGVERYQLPPPVVKEEQQQPQPPPTAATPPKTDNIDALNPYSPDDDNAVNLNAGEEHLAQFGL